MHTLWLGDGARTPLRRGAECFRQFARQALRVVRTASIPKGLPCFNAVQNMLRITSSPPPIVQMSKLTTRRNLVAVRHQNSQDIDSNADMDNLTISDAASTTPWLALSVQSPLIAKITCHRRHIRTGLQC
jgi:hypothetical protein